MFSWLSLPANVSMIDILGTSIPNLIYLYGFIVKDILWLRILIIVGMSIETGYHFRDLHSPEWAEIGWCSFYILVNGWQFTMLYKERRNLKFTDEEQAIHNKVFKSMPSTAFKKLLSIASWQELPKDYIIIRQHTHVEQLALISDGLCKVVIDDKEVGFVRNGNFIGEMSFLSGNETTATVTTIDDTRCLVWNKEQLKKLMSTDHEVEISMQSVFSSDLLSKLMVQQIH